MSQEQCSKYRINYRKKNILNNQEKFLNSKKLSELDKKSLRHFRYVFDNSGFNSNTLLKIFGKEVTRHINISSRELHYLRSQLLYNKTNLLYLADLFLLSKKVKKNTW